MDKLKLELTDRELDLIMQHLQVGQWRVVNDLINNLLAQANNQPKLEEPQ